MSRRFTTTVRLDAQDVKALASARKDGLMASELIRRGLRLIAAKYYGEKRPPTTGLFETASPKLGDESELFGDLEP